VPIGSQDGLSVSLFHELLKPLADRVRQGGIAGSSAAGIVYRCGYTMMKFGEWLMAREPPGHWTVERIQTWQRSDSAPDIEALVEMALKQETGAPFPPVDPS
jgi:hypothetical protein